MNDNKNHQCLSKKKKKKSEANQVSYNRVILMQIMKHNLLDIMELLKHGKII